MTFSKLLLNENYHQTSKIRHNVVGNQIVDQSDVVGASPVNIGLDNDLVTNWQQAIIWTSDV